MEIDRPIETKKEDLFGTGQYVEALSKFIQDSVESRATPITLGIQGDWGSGKTSLLNLLKIQLGESYLSINFNSWVFSNEQNIGGELILRAANAVMDAAEKIKEKKLASKLYEGLNYLFHAGWRMAEGFLQKKGIDLSYQRKKNTEFSQFHDHFADSVGKILQKTGKRALIFYIDDLDRVPPTKAIELTEAIKNFLDVPGCVFLIACDYRVIQKGLLIKFGFSEKSRESHQYLDKIFQIPFRMPVFRKNERQKYIKNCFDDESFSDEHIITLDEIIATLQMANPRAIKRIAGVFKLLCYVQKPQQTIEKMNFLTLVILQQYSTSIYQFLAQNENAPELLALGQENEESINTEVLKDFEENEEILERFTELFRINTFFQDWLQKEAYCPYLGLTGLAEPESVTKPGDNSKQWNTTKFKAWLEELSDSNIRNFSLKILHMFEELCKNFPSQDIKKAFPYARARVVYGHGYSPTLSIQVVHKTMHRRVISYYPDPNAQDDMRCSECFCFFYWNVSSELCRETIKYFHNKIFPHIFAKTHRDSYAKIKDMTNGDESLPLLKEVIREMMEVRIRPESCFSKEELQERLT